MGCVVLLEGAVARSSEASVIGKRKRPCLVAKWNLTVGQRGFIYGVTGVIRSITHHLCHCHKMPYWEFSPKLYANLDFSYS